MSRRLVELTLEYIWSCGVLLLLHNGSPSLIPVLVNFYLRAWALKDKLLDAWNKYRHDSNHYNQTLAYTLTELYVLVGKPVNDRPGQINVPGPKQSHVWLCPTLVFCSLPLHSLGSILSDDDGQVRYFFDIYILSYTTTLIALILESGPRGLGTYFGLSFITSCSPFRRAFAGRVVVRGVRRRQDRAGTQYEAFSKESYLRKLRQF